MKRVLVTGANGFVGSHVVSYLVEAGYVVTATVRTPSSCVADSGAEWVVCQTVADYEALVSKVEALVHCGGVAHRSNASVKEFEEGNTEWTRILADAVARSQACRMMVYLSSIAARKHDADDSESGVRAMQDPYGWSKKRAEIPVIELQAEGKIGVTLRPPLIYGPGAPGNWAKLLSLAKLPVPLPFANVQAKRHYLDRIALSRAIETVLQRSEAQDVRVSGCYEIADREGAALPEIIGALRRTIGVRRFLIPGPVGLMDRGLRCVGRGGIADGLFQPLTLDWRPFAETFAWQPECDTLDAMKQSVLRWRRRN